MIYAPLGHVWSKSVVDPFWLLQEYYEAMRITQRSTQYQWQAYNRSSSEGITEISNVARGESVAILTANKVANMSMAQGTDPAPDGDTFDIPYNSGFEKIDDTEVTWISQYPELVVVGLNFQYYRRSIETGAPGGDLTLFRIRSKVKIAIDDIHQQGSGPYALPVTTTPRGTGLAMQAGRFCSVVVASLTAGAHSVFGVAGQSIGTPSLTEVFSKRDDLSDDPPLSNKVVIGNRKTIVIRFALGRWLGA